MECARLWEKYAEATFDFVKLDAQFKIASLRYESLVVMARLNEGVTVAARRRDAALERVKQHEASQQMRKAAAAASLESKFSTTLAMGAGISPEARF
jgi:hypothetical protein